MPAPPENTRSGLSAEEFAAGFMWDLEAHDSASPRSQQSQRGEIGASDIGFCREQVRRRLAHLIPTDAPNKWSALLGNYVDAGTKAARRASGRPNLHHDLRLQVTLPSGVTFPCSLDELDTDEPSYTDVKTKDGLALIRRTTAGDQPRMQRHVCYLAALQNGLVPEEGIVRNIFLDRSGADRHPHVEQEPFSMDVIHEADAWLSDAVYAAEHGEEAMKDAPRPVCEQFCEFYTACRGREPVQEEFLAGHRARVLAEMVAAKTRRDEAAAVYDQARGELKGVTGRSTVHWVRSTVMNNKTASVRVDVGEIEGAV